MKKNRRILAGTLLLASMAALDGCTPPWARVEAVYGPPPDFEATTPAPTDTPTPDELKNPEEVYGPPVDYENTSVAPGSEPDELDELEEVYGPPPVWDDETVDLSEVAPLYAPPADLGD